MKRLALALLLIGVAAAPAAAAPSATVARAEAAPDWTSANVAGTATWDACPLECNWVAILNVQPALPSYSCRAADWRSSDPNIKGIWSSGARAANGTASFDMPNAPVLPGVAGQRVCVVSIAHTLAQSPTCLIIRREMGLDPSTCAYLDTITERVLGDRIMTIAPPAIATPVDAPPVAPPPCANKRGNARKKCKALRRCARIKSRAKRKRCTQSAKRRYR